MMLPAQSHITRWLARWLWETGQWLGSVWHRYGRGGMRSRSNLPVPDIRPISYGSLAHNRRKKQSTHIRRHGIDLCR